jgi:hypothetical protein
MEIALLTGLFSLGGVVLGALLMPLTQLYLEKKREQRAADRAKLLVAGELLHAQYILRNISKAPHWPHVEDVNAFLPISAWRESRSSLAGNVDKDLWDELVMAYALLEFDRGRFVLASRLPETPLLATRDAEGIKQTSNDLGRVRRKLGGGGGGWLDELHDEFKPQIESFNDDFKRWLDGLSEDDLKKDAVIAKVKEGAKALEALNRHLGNEGPWYATGISDAIKWRLKC